MVILFYCFLFVLLTIAAWKFFKTKQANYESLPDEEEDEIITENTIEVEKGVFVRGAEAEDYKKQNRRMRKHLEKEFRRKIKKGILVAVPDGEGGVLGYITRGEAKEKGLI